MFFFLAYFTLYNWLQFHPSHQNWFKCILFNGWVILHCVYVPQLSYLLKLVFSIFGSGIARSYYCSIYIFLRNCHTVFHRDCTDLHSQQCRRVLFSLHPCQHFLFSVLFGDNYSDRCEVISPCGFDFHSLMISDVEHLFMCLLAIHMSSYNILTHIYGI